MSIPNFDAPHMYGVGIGLRTNAQGFRNRESFDLVPPPGKLRVVSSGDSFTLGNGVDDDHTLVSSSPRWTARCRR